MQYNRYVLFIKRLVWDEWNVAHIAKHDVIPDEVEEICNGEHIVQKGKKGRFLVFGLIKSGRMITVVLDPEGNNVYYPVTARSTSRRERLIYKKEKEVEKNDKKEKHSS